MMIRNNKRRVTDMTGRPLFAPVKVDREEYRYDDAERRFYELLTEYIVSGKAYASQCGTGAKRRRSLTAPEAEAACQGNRLRCDLYRARRED